MTEFVVKKKEKRETAKVRTQGPLKIQWKGGEFRKKRKEKKWTKKKEKEKEEGEGQKKEIVEKVQREDRMPHYGEEQRG